MARNFFLLLNCFAEVTRVEQTRGDKIEFFLMIMSDLSSLGKFCNVKAAFFFILKAPIQTAHLPVMVTGSCVIGEEKMTVSVITFDRVSLSVFDCKE
ncbi:MAG: hypothetical protein HC905_06675 [Bacteroidales bacterium]|nr:hypothetical protein [Bacteroidales bacterium]